ncbi:hypothetical protein BAAM0499_00400 [Bifidobacterium animalis subsp. animalis MCC 0499]|nr:hypothetical protein BAAM0499_00400 [Bifidobacterium animalis subsp. animalis MCC 0499]
MLAVANGKRHIHRRQSKRRQLAHRAGTGPAYHQIRAGERLVYALQVLRDVVVASRLAFLAQTREHIGSGVLHHQITYLVNLALACQMHDLRHFGELPGAAGNGTVHALRSQRTAGDHDDRPVRVKTEFGGIAGSGAFPVAFQLLGEIRYGRSQWQSHTLDSAILCRLESGCVVGGANELRPTGAQLVGHAGTGILLMDHHRNPEPMRGGIGRRRCVAAEADDHLGALVLKVLHHLGLLRLPFAGKF